MRLSATTNSSAEANVPVHASTSGIMKLNYACGARYFSSGTTNYVSRGFRCSPKATDMPNLVVNAGQTTVLVPNLRTVAISENGVRIRLLTDLSQRQKSRFCDITLVDNQILAAVPETSFLSTTTFEKQSNQSTRWQFTFDDKNSILNPVNRIGTLTFTAK